MIMMIMTMMFMMIMMKMTKMDIWRQCMKLICRIGNHSLLNLEAKPSR